MELEHAPRVGDQTKDKTRALSSLLVQASPDIAVAVAVAVAELSL